ncbi:glutamate ligase domain-containing protein [Methylocucumis oryzae]|uniref:glutamate ligase domain-containing protein n=1 Tax=Methylocucumis oryzae TaxID=1632867 RepID=UPI003F6AD03F
MSMIRRFFDKRSKFVHYRPKTAILNNLEYDHADIFPDLAAIKKQFHHLVRTVPRSGCIIAPIDDDNIADVLSMGCWSERKTTGLSSAADWYADKLKPDGSQFMVYHQSRSMGQVNWALTGDHNVRNALSALAAACRVGVNPEAAISALSAFQNVKRRMEVIFKTDNTVIYDDFAHHPTAIATTLHGLRQQVGDEKIIAVVEPRSNTMRLGIHTETLADSLKYADLAILFQPSDLNWDVSQLKKRATNLEVYATLTDILQRLQVEARKGAHIVIMSNGGFGGIYQKLPTIVVGQ